MAGFQNILGHEQTINSLKNAIMLGKVSHAYIFNGEEGSGKKTLAEAFAMTLQCEKGGKDACHECRSCKQFMTHNQPDMIYLEPSKEGLIRVDDIREQVNATVQIKPYSSPYKIYLIEHADSMNEQAQNALLKTMEEPPEYVVIILLTENADRLLPTIRSRAVTMELHPVADELVMKYLTEVLSVPERDAAVCTAYAQGNVGKAARMSTAEDFKELKDHVTSLLKHIEDMDLLAVTEEVKESIKWKLRIEDYFDLLVVWYRDVLVYKATADANRLIFQDELYDIKKQSENHSYEGIENIIKAIDQAKSRYSANVKLELCIETMLMEMKEN